MKTRPVSVLLFDDMTELLQDCEAYLDCRSDVSDGDDGVPLPNAEMTLLSRLNELLGIIAKMPQLVGRIDHDR